jgi:hypothetical protein
VTGRLALPFAVAIAYAVGYTVDSSSNLWKNSFLFVSLITFFVVYRLIIFYKSKTWKIKDEWVFFPLYLVIIPSLWLWIGRFDAAFILLYFFLHCTWIVYVQSLLSLEDGHD